MKTTVKIFIFAIRILIMILIFAGVSRWEINRALPPSVQAQLARQEKEAQLQQRAVKLRDDFLALHPEQRQQQNAPVNVTTSPPPAIAAPAPSATPAQSATATPGKK